MDGWTLVAAAMRAAKENRNDLVQSIERLVETEAWRNFTTPAGDLVEHVCLGDFIESQPNRGLGLSVGTLVSLLEDTNLPESARLVRRAVLASRPEANEVGRPSANVRDTNNTSEHDNSAYVVSRLKRDDPQLAAEVVEGKLSPNAAAVKAGIRHKYARIRTDSAERAVAKLLEHYEREQVLRALGGAA
jgi:hypothetical protein